MLSNIYALILEVSVVLVSLSPHALSPSKQTGGSPVVIIQGCRHKQMHKQSELL